jgi:hypothetical protein
MIEEKTSLRGKSPRIRGEACSRDKLFLISGVALSLRISLSLEVEDRGRSEIEDGLRVRR